MSTFESYEIPIFSCSTKCHYFSKVPNQVKHRMASLKRWALSRGWSTNARSCSSVITRNRVGHLGNSLYSSAGQSKITNLQNWVLIWQSFFDVILLRKMPWSLYAIGCQVTDTFTSPFSSMKMFAGLISLIWFRGVVLSNTCLWIIPWEWIWCKPSIICLRILHLSSSSMSPSSMA